MKLRAIAIILAVAGMALAGCVRESPDESGGEIGTPCLTQFVTIHWEGTFDEAALRAAFEEAGYAWITDDEAAGDEGELLETRERLGVIDGVAVLDPPGGQAVRGIVAFDPGTSTGESLILSFEETAPSADPSAVGRTASDAADIVNATFEDARIDQWIEDEWSVGCDEPGAIPPGPR